MSPTTHRPRAGWRPGCWHSQVRARRGRCSRRWPTRTRRRWWTRSPAPWRLQRFERDGVEVVVDVAHNAQAARGLAAWLLAQPGARTTRAVFAALADKDAAAMVDALAGSVAGWHLAGLDGVARGQDVEAFAARLSSTAAATASRDARVADALARALAAAAPGGRVLVFGSFHTAAAALEALHSAA